MVGFEDRDTDDPCDTMCGESIIFVGFLKQRRCLEVF